MKSIDIIALQCVDPSFITIIITIINYVKYSYETNKLNVSHICVYSDYERLVVPLFRNRWVIIIMFVKTSDEAANNTDNRM